MSNETPDERTRKRIVGTARYWQKKFGLNYDMLDDVISMAWVAWYERPTVELERRLQQVNNQVRREILREIWGVVPHSSKIPDWSPVYRGVIDQEYDVDFIGRVRLREIVDACNKAKLGMGHNTDHVGTIAIYAGLRTRSSKKNLVARGVRLRKFLESKGLAA